MSEKLIQLSRKLGEVLLNKQLMLATAESCTGGLLASQITSVAGCSNWFERGFITYSNFSKQEMLDVLPETLKQWGAVSEQVVREMALGALKNSKAQVSVAITGIAGPTGGSQEKPVGTVWIACACIHEVFTKHHLYSGDRISIQQQATNDALTHLLNYLT